MRASVNLKPLDVSAAAKVNASITRLRTPPPKSPAQPATDPHP